MDRSVSRSILLDILMRFFLYLLVICLFVLQYFGSKLFLRVTLLIVHKQNLERKILKHL